MLKIVTLPYTSRSANMSMMEYTRSFGITMKESVKKVTEWAAYYHTSRKSWYLEPEETIPFSESAFDKPSSHRRHVERELRHYARLGSSIWSCSTTANSSQETTMAKHGTLHEFMYQRHCIYSDDPVHVDFEEAIRDVLEAGRPEDDNQTVRAMDDESSDEDDVETSNESGTFLQGEIGSSTTFLLGAGSSFFF